MERHLAGFFGSVHLAGYGGMFWDYLQVMVVFFLE